MRNPRTLCDAILAEEPMKKTKPMRLLSQDMKIWTGPLNDRARAEAHAQRLEKLLLDILDVFLFTIVFTGIVAVTIWIFKVI